MYPPPPPKNAFAAPPRTCDGPVAHHLVGRSGGACGGGRGRAGGCLLLRAAGAGPNAQLQGGGGGDASGGCGSAGARDVDQGAHGQGAGRARVRHLDLGREHQRLAPTNSHPRPPEAPVARHVGAAALDLPHAGHPWRQVHGHVDGWDRRAALWHGQAELDRRGATTRLDGLALGRARPGERRAGQLRRDAEGAGQQQHHQQQRRPSIHHVSREEPHDGRNFLLCFGQNDCGKK